MPGPTTPTAYPGVAPNTGYPGYPGYSSYPPSAGYGYPGYPQGSYGYGHPVALPPNNGLAIASLACACAGIIPFLFGIPCVLGIIFGFVARNQIARSNPRQRGEGLALAGIIVGFSLIALFIIFVIVLANVNHNQTCFGSGC